MIENIENNLSSRINNYDCLENRYRRITGSELVTEPYSSIMQELNLDLTVSIIIAAWNAQSTITQCLKAIELSSFNLKFSQQLQVIVVDDGSTDNTWDIICSLSLNLNLQAVRQNNTGQYRALNTALSLAEGEIVISCDDDMILDFFCIEELVKRHQVLDDVILIGFRSNIEPTHPNIQLQSVEKNLTKLSPIFYNDNRLFWDWIGIPESMATETNHYKNLTGTKTIYISDGLIPDGDPWTLPQMVYGALFSMKREDYNLIGGYDESFQGWGYGDTLIGAQAYANGRYIVPVYSATGFHVNHPDRSVTKWQEANANLARYNSILKMPVNYNSKNEFMMEQRKNRIKNLYQQEAKNQKQNIPLEWRKYRLNNLKDPLLEGKYNYYLGKYKEAVESFRKVKYKFGEVPHSTTFLAKSLNACGSYSEAIEELNEGIALYPKDVELQCLLALSKAALGDFRGANKIIELVRDSTVSNSLYNFIKNPPIEAFIRRAERNALQGDYNWAIRDYEVALIKDMTNTQALRGRERCLNVL